MKVFAGNASQELAKKIVNELAASGRKAELGESVIKRFPDGECYARILSKIRSNEEAVVIQSTSKPQDENLIELLFLMHGLKKMGAELTCIIPYFGYGRQDRAFEEGEVVSSRAVAELIESSADRVLTINLHKKHILNFFKIPARELDATPLIAKYFKEHFEAGRKNIVISPDEGSFTLAKEVAGKMACEAEYFKKRRIAPGEVKTQAKDINARNKNVLIIDDIIDSGYTIVEAVKILKERKPRSVNVACIHGVLTGNAITKIYAAGADTLVSTNTIPSQISRICISKLIAKELNVKELKT